MGHNLTLFDLIRVDHCRGLVRYWEVPAGEKNAINGKWVEAPADDIHWELISLAMMSVANMVIFPMQDILGLGEEARMNRHATTEGNWQWQLLPDQLTPPLAERLLEMMELYGRA